MTHHASNPNPTFGDWRLSASPEPPNLDGKSVDVLVVGSGIAGLFTALEATRLGSVALVTKAALEESNTRYAQGGIAAVMFDDDEVDLHIADTLAAGAGLCDDYAVRVLCAEGPERIRDLLRIGVEFDRDGESFARGLEGAHSRSRVLHAGGDATGAMIEAALANAVRQTGVAVYEHTFLTDLIVENGCATGGRFLDADDQPFEIRASATILASGGAGQVYRHTTNPDVATGDGVAAAFRAGAVVADGEFYQFHPTALALGDTYLVSEAVRGEGAVLRNAKGEAFMQGRHPLGDLAPRDVVARAIAEEMANQDGTPVVLDATAFGPEFLAARFPSIDAYCRARGVDWSTTPVPVTPAAHYWMGGVRTDTWGRTNIPSLFAVGEVTATGVHGANRLASNSLLEGIVFGHRIVRHLEHPQHDEGPQWNALEQITVEHADAVAVDRDALRRLTWDHVGLVREAQGLAVARKQLNGWTLPQAPQTRADWELGNLLVVARLITAGASVREESRGGHFRSDFPATDPTWVRHVSFGTW